MFLGLGLDLRFRVQGFRDLWFRVQGFRDLWFRVSGLGFAV